MQQDYYQLSRNHHLVNLCFRTKKEARLALKSIFVLLQKQSFELGYQVIKRHSYAKNMLYLYIVYPDGFTEKDIYIIKSVKVYSTSVIIF